MIITSNRDEKITRPVALPPEIYVADQKKIVFPEDPLSGGSWFSTDEKGNTAVLLNGAKQKHISRGSYRKSRGLILLELIKAASPITHWTTINLENIEPFTVMLFQASGLYLLRWDGHHRETTSLEADRNHILSSSTLYTKALQKQREQWFFDFMARNRPVSPETLLSFHRYTEKEDKKNDLVIDRGNLLKTLSITQCIIKKDSVIMHYRQLFPNEKLSTVQL